MNIGVRVIGRDVVRRVEVDRHEVSLQLRIAIGETRREGRLQMEEYTEGLAKNDYTNLLFGKSI